MLRSERGSHEVVGVKETNVRRKKNKDEHTQNICKVYSVVSATMCMNQVLNFGECRLKSMCKRVVQGTEHMGISGFI